MKHYQKRWMDWGAGVLALLLIALLLVGCGAPQKEETETEAKSLDDMVSSALLSQNAGRYAEGECVAEGHIVLGSEKKEEETKVYALTMYGEYGFQNGHFVKVSGSGVIPAVLIFSIEDNGSLPCRIEWPTDGEGYIQSIKALFPEAYWERVLSIRDKDQEELAKQERTYAEAYLKDLGRVAEIGDYADFSYVLLTDEGVSVEVSNQLLEKEFAAYPYWIGDEEKIEDGVRTVYETAYNKDNQEVLLTKYIYDTYEIKEKWRIGAQDGKEKRMKESLSPSGFAGSSLHDIELYSDGGVYLVTYTGEGKAAWCVIEDRLLALDAQAISLTEDGGIALEGENVRLSEEALPTWIFLE